MQSKKAILLFTRNPELGKVKTRIAKTLGNQKALEIYKKLLHHTREIVAHLKADKYVFYSDLIPKDDMWENDIFIKRMQRGTTLGDKMSIAFEEVFNNNYDSICIIGSDCYELNPTIIENAFQLLQVNDCVIGPTFDGGYYLLGMNKFHTELFQNIEWSTETVFEETLKICSKLNLKTVFTNKLNDVDTENDVPRQWL